MTWQSITRLLLLACVALLALYDVVAFWCGGEEATISRVAYRAACQHPVIAFACGFVCGHVFWPN